MEKRFLSSSQRAWLAGLRARGARVVPDDVASAARRASGVGYGLLRRSSVSLVAGLLGSLAAILVMVGLRLAWGTPTLPELVGERILPLMSANQFVSLLIRF
ncbi:MAG: hypothetical protein IVW57_11420 [Ktedonobacterales bacterium]|nr:hypothetical protein [Ktedonobacterales bacterium]